MLPLIEGLFSIYLVYRIYAIFKHSLARNLADALTFAAGILESSLLMLLSYLILSQSVRNVVLPALLSVTVGASGYLLLTLMLTKRCHPAWERRMRRVRAIGQPPRWAELTAKSVIALLLLGYLTAIAGGLIWAISLSPRRRDMARQSLFMSAMLTLFPDRPSNVSAAVDARLFLPRSLSVASFECLLPDRRRVTDAFRRGIRETGDFIADAAGLDELQEQTRLMRALLELSDTEKLWLFETTPALQQIAETPSVLAILEDERLMTLIERASRGSLPALYRLGDEAAIRSLFQDRTLAARLKQIHLESLLQRIEQYRRN